MVSASKFNYHDVINQITCRIQTPNNAGTGVIIYTAKTDIYYILTAKHVLFKKNQQQAIEALGDISINIKYKKEFHEISRECIEQVYCTNDDVALLVLRNLNTEIPGIPKIKLSVTKFTHLPCFFRGYPQSDKNNEGININVKFSENYVVTTPTPLSTHDSDPLYNCKGFSGSGLFCTVKNQAYLIGIITDLKEPFQRFKIYNFSFVNGMLKDNGLPEIEMVDSCSLEEDVVKDNIQSRIQTIKSPIPKNLIENIKEGRVVLFLTRSIMMDAIHPQKHQYPSVDDIRDIIVEKFLSDEFKNYDIDEVIDLAISESELFAVQELISSQYDKFKPLDYHKTISKYVWHAIATTSIDLVFERAYDSEKDKLQTLVVFKKNGERVEQKLKESNSVQFLKLHGCITAINDHEIPLILTSNQYQNSQSGRSRLFNRLKEMAYEYPFLILSKFINDPDVKTAIQIISSIVSTRPMSYIVSENKTDAEVRLLSNKKITHIHLHPKQFLTKLDETFPSTFRVLATLKHDDDFPASKHFKMGALSPSNSLKIFLECDVQYVHSNLKAEDVDARAFYRGYFNDFGAIVSNLDVRRRVNDDIISEIFLTSETEKNEQIEFCVIKGHAGSGKSVLLKRIAWDVATEFDQICLIVNNSMSSDYEPLAELFRLCGKRIFLFVDPIREYTELIQDFIVKARKDQILLTIVGAERFSTWNSYCEELEAHVTQTYEMGYLSEKEIYELISLLGRHNSQGYLKN